MFATSHNSALSRRALRGGRRGVALVITLWVVLIMTVMAYSILYETNINVELTRQYRDRFYAMVLARSGLGRAAVDLLNDLRYDVASVGIGKVVDAKGDPWAREDEEYTDSDSDRKMLHGTYTVRVVDENRFLPLNARNMAALEKLVQVLGIEDEEESQKIAAAVADYVDADEMPSLPQVEAGLTENDLYEELIREDLHLRSNERVRYRNKNDRFITRDELLQIYGITEDLFYGSDWPLEPDDRIRWRRPRYYDRLDLPRDYRPGLRDLVSVYADDAINLNTILPEVAHAMFSVGSDSLNQGEDAAKELITRRPEPGRSGRQPDNDRALETFANLPEIGIDLSAASGARGVAPISGRSTAFRIHSSGTVRDVSYTIEVIVDREWDRVARDDSRGGYGRGRRRRESSRDRDDQQIEEMPALRALEWREVPAGSTIPRM